MRIEKKEYETQFYFGFELTNGCLIINMPFGGIWIMSNKYYSQTWGCDEVE